MAYDVVVVGGGIVGAACAYSATRRGLSVCVVDRGAIAGGTSSAGEGNVLVSDKEPGPEQDLAMLSNSLWREFGQEELDGGILADAIELEPKGGLVVAASPEGLTSWATLAEEQARSGVQAQAVPSDRLGDCEPNLSPELAGGYLYPQDMQLQPMLAAAALLRLARKAGSEVFVGREVIGFLRSGNRVTGVNTTQGTISAAAVVNAAGTWAGEIAALAGVDVPVAPRRGFILVTEPLPRVVRHKVYSAEYVGNVASGSAALQTSTVVEGTRSGPVLIGATRERVGFDRSWSSQAIKALAAGAVTLFPFLREVSALRAYRGFRPYCPDHLPVVGPDPRATGLWHACGHEGAGVGLAAATGHLVAQSLCGLPTDLTLDSFRPDRFGAAA